MIRNLETTDFPFHVEKVREILNGALKRVCVLTFGCQQNEADSERILGMAVSMGYTVTADPEDADLIILNTCAIRKHAEEKALSMLGRFKAIKKRKPSVIIGVCGCMAAELHIKEMLKNDFHYVTFTIEPNMIHKLPMLIHKALIDNKRGFIFGEDIGDISEGIPALRSSSHKAWVSIMYGCNNFCSYCIVPYVRGRERSRDSRQIIEECRQLVESGVKEITLLGQNVNSYKGEYGFAGLLREIAKIEGDFIVRFMTSHPKDVSDELISVMRDNSPKIAPYFHLPLQSGSDRILKAMRRTYDRERFLSVVDALRDAIPNICISTDVIVGFPTEEEQDFLDTLDVLQRARFDMVYAFKYSPRVGTPAADMTPAVDLSVKEERISRLLKMQDAISLESNERYVGTVQRVLVDSPSRRSEFKTFSARTMTNKLVHFEGDEDMIGKFALVKIERAGAYDLYAKKIEE